MSVNNWPAVIFDLDDTLYPEEQFVQGGLWAVSRVSEEQLGTPQPVVWQELCQLLPTSPRGRLLDTWLERRSTADRALLPKLVQAYREHSPQLQLHPGLRDLLERLQAERRLGVVTDGWLAVQQRKFRALAVDHLFQAVVYSDAWGRDYWKPHPRPFQSVLAQLHCEASQAVYIGDNPTKDFIGCRALGMATIHLRLPAGVYHEVTPPTPEHAADLVVTSICELGEALCGTRGPETGVRSH